VIGAGKLIIELWTPANNKKSYLIEVRNWRTKMKRKPDILVVLAALLGLGMILSSFSGVNAADVQTEVKITRTK